MSQYSDFFIGNGFHPYNFEDKERNVKEQLLYDLAYTQSMFKYTGLPETIPQRMMELYLQSAGVIAISDKANGNLYAYTGGLGGEPDEYYQPTLFTVSNPAQNFSSNLKIGEECVVIRNDALGIGLIPYLSKINTLLCETDISIRIVTINSRLMSLLTAEDDSVAEAARKYLKDIESGKLGAISLDSVFEGLKVQPYADKGNSNNVTQLMELYQFLKGQKYATLGLSAAYNMKRTYIGESESSLNDDILLPYLDDMLRSRREGIEQVNEKYGTDIQVDLDSSWALRHYVNGHEEETEDVSRETLDNTEPTEETEDVSRETLDDTEPTGTEEQKEGGEEQAGTIVEINVNVETDDSEPEQEEREGENE